MAAGEALGSRPFATWYEPLEGTEEIFAAVSWVLAHQEITGLATPGDVRLLAAVVAAERSRMSLDQAAAVLASVEGYASPFAAMPAGL